MLSSLAYDGLMGLAGRGGVTALPTNGLVGVWYADQFAASPRPYIPNSSVTNVPSASLLGPPRRMFSGGVFWNVTGTIVDDAATAPDGSMEASTITAAGNWNIRHNGSAIALPAGTYTLCASVKINGSGPANFKMAFAGATVLSPTKTATSSWQRFTFTATRPTETDYVFPIISPDFFTGCDLQTCDLEMFAGSADLNPNWQTKAAIVSDLHPGNHAFDAGYSCSGGVLDLTTTGFGVIQLPANVTLSSGVTIAATVNKAVDNGIGQQTIIAGKTPTLFAAQADSAKRAILNYNSQAIAQDTNGLFNLLGMGWHTLISRYDGATWDLWVDDAHLKTKAVVLAAPTVRDFFVGVYADLAQKTGLKLNAIALYDRALTNGEVAAANTALSSRATLSGLTKGTLRVYCAEGDSITGFFTYCYPYKFGPNASPPLVGTNLGINGSTIANLESRAAAADAILPSALGNRKFILSVLQGRNDGPAMATGTFLTRLAAYCDARRAAGWKIVICTLLPSTAVGFNAWRNTVNATIVTWAGVHADAVCDFAADSTMGIDGNGSTTGPWNATYYADGTHPTDAGQAILETIIRPVINGL